ncbi:hypothetical protein PK35_14485 [Tamlana nanhaiensis]|uniref:histidine kinase n=1 Tax=Neotamlana nanhaiensis TaxID=1382798 RepID=A0A0D7VXN0_9FLAO|nr:hybrid sensor histidine kinase/response regulator transcription factor [Tamlana nanhaiensis]KJD31606.1 hypothetical protein PK35_14485 [Tamlana nanhaiensis]
MLFEKGNLLIRLSKKLLLCCVFMVLAFNKVSAQKLFFEKVYGQEKSPVTSIHGITKDSIGYIWFGSWNGAYRYDGKDFDLYQHNPNDDTSIPNNRIRNIVTDENLGLWLLTFDWKYVKYNYKLNSFTVVNDDQVSETIKTKLSNKSNNINRDNVINGNHYFMHLLRFMSRDIKTGEETTYVADINQPGNLFDDFVTSFFIDDTNVIWLGTRNGDVYKVNPNRNPFDLHYTYRPNTKKEKLITVRDILKVDDKLWLGTDEGVIIYKNNNELDANNAFYKSNLQMNYVRTFFKDKNEDIWIGGVDGLEFYDRSKNKCTEVFSRELDSTLLIPAVHAMESYNDDILWVALFDRMARINLKDKSVDFFFYAEDLQGHIVTDILKLDDYTFLLATEGKGIIQLSSTKKMSETDSITSSESKFNNEVLGSILYALHQDKNNDIWVGSIEGLSRIRVEKNSFVTEKINLRYDTPEAYISSITDDDDNIWVSHKEGISAIDINTGFVSSYQKKDQYNSWSFWERAFFKDTTNNIIYYGTKNGYVAFNPKDIKSNISNTKKVILKSLYLANEEVHPLDSINGKPVLLKSLSHTNSINLDYENRSFSVGYSLFNYNEATKEIFEYKLEGYDDDWIKTLSNKVTYNKVPPGDYVFKVRPFNPDAEKTIPYSSLSVHIENLWYRTMLAKSVITVVLIGIFFFFFREILYRDRLKNQIKLERVNREQQAALNRDKIEFFTNVSHELKTPLTLISDPLKQLQKKGISKENSEIYLSIVNRNVKHLTRLINQILDFRKSEQGKLKLKPSPCDFSDIIQNCSQSFKPVAKNRQIEFNYLVETTPLYCAIDAEKTEQIIMNLLSNAFKYTPNGGKVNLNVRLNNKKQAIKITITDTGVGIDKESLNEVFKPFNNIGSRPFHGNSSGIGLSLTKNLIDILNGSIKLSSEPQKGTKVSVKLPYVEVTEAEALGLSENSAKAVVVKTEEESTKDINKTTILVVEDNVDVQTYLNKELSGKYRLLQEYNGKDGLKAAIKNIPDLIISDVMMPIMEGVDMCKHIKMNESTCHIPIIMLTAKASDEHQIEGFNLGAEAYIPKPFSIGVLKAQISSILDNRVLLQKQLAGIKSINELQEDAPDLDNVFLKKLTDFIMENIQDPEFNSEKLAEYLQISQSQLYRKLKAVSGSTVHQFIIRVKMDHAKQLLINSDLNVSQIAYETGFTEPSNFSRTFSKYYGSSPSKYLSKLSS